MFVKFAPNGKMLNNSFFQTPMNQVLESFVKEAFPETERAAAYRPLTDVVETENAFLFQVQLPGFTKEEVKIELKDRKLSISAEHAKPEEGAPTPKFLHKETFDGQYKRSFNLPRLAHTEGISAAFENGILTLTVPKKDVTEGVTTISIN